MLHWKVPELNDVHRKFDSSYKGHFFMSESCTVLIKNVDSDLIVAHSTWSDYNMMLRIINRARTFSESSEFTNHFQTSYISIKVRNTLFSDARSVLKKFTEIH